MKGTPMKSNNKSENKADTYGEFAGDELLLLIDLFAGADMMNVLAAGGKAIESAMSLPTTWHQMNAIDFAKSNFERVFKRTVDDIELEFIRRKHQVIIARRNLYNPPIRRLDFALMMLQTIFEDAAKIRARSVPIIGGSSKKSIRKCADRGMMLTCFKEAGEWISKADERSKFDNNARKVTKEDRKILADMKAACCVTPQIKTPTIPVIQKTLPPSRSADHRPLRIVDPRTKVEF
jgi:hypothetical protein